jgi:hypothetical protein
MYCVGLLLVEPNVAHLHGYMLFTKIMLTEYIRGKGAEVLFSVSV